MLLSAAPSATVMPPPTVCSALLFRLSDITILCAADKGAVTRAEPVVEGVSLMKGEKATVVVNMHDLVRVCV